MFRLDRQQWRFYLAGRRIHHGACGMFLIIFGAVLAWHDWADRKDWF